MSAFSALAASLLVALSAVNVIVHGARGNHIAAAAWLAVVLLVALPRLMERVRGGG